ncbi:hypothetical protein BDM02DRAFT_3091696, partial [Thelephora ganbajun]
SRPRTPELPSTSSLRDATTTIDDLTSAMAKFSRMSNPPLPDSLSCCCGRDECTNHQAWVEFKAKLESQLILCAEVGQALLQRHEAYVRRHPRTDEDKTRLESEVNELRSQNASLEKRLARALVNSEVSEASNNVVLQELQDTRSNLSRLTTQHTKCVGLESRLARVTTEKEDLQQERDNASQRARVAEARIVSLRDRMSRLQEQLTTLHTELDQHRNHRLELSEEISQGARTQLEAWLRSKAITKMLETLVTDNEMLKRDGEELQRLLSESREDFRALQEELDELRASENRKYSRHRSGSAKSSMHLPALSLAPLSPRSTRSFSGGAGFTRLGKRAVSAERNLYEPFTPSSDRGPASPDPWDRNTQVDGLVTPSRLLLELDGETVAATPANKRPLLLLTRSRGVQTDPHSYSRSSLAPSPLPIFDSHSSADAKSESSSVTDSVPSVLSSVLDRASSLLHRLVLSDALTLTNRLKRQHLTGDVSHLSRTTVGSIVSEATLLRSNFRSLLEDDKIITVCTRKDLRALFNLLKDAFNELGELRMTLNDVILDPSLAPKISEAAMNPSKGVVGKETAGGAAGWIAPIVKLFQGGEEKSTSSSSPNISSYGLPRSSSQGGAARTQRPTPRIAPKLSPALSASTTTVNVEFQSGSSGRAITSTHSAHPSSSEAAKYGGQETSEEEIRAKTSASVMGIFAGAPKPLSPQDPWIVIPKPSRKPSSPLSKLTRSGLGSGTLTVGRNTLKANPQLSRVVDAVIDVQSPTVAATPSDYQATLAHRGLRPRGLSDSSIHTTFLNRAEDRSGPSEVQQPEASEQPDQEPTSSGMLVSFGKKVLGLRSVSSFGPLSRGATPKPPIPKLTYTSPSTSGSNSIPGTANPSTVNTSVAPSPMRSPISPTSRVQEESDDDDLVSPATSRGTFFQIAGTRVNVDAWSGNEPYVGSMRQEWMTARESGPGGRDY